MDASEAPGKGAAEDTDSFPLCKAFTCLKPATISPQILQFVIKRRDSQALPQPGLWDQDKD